MTLGRDVALARRRRQLTQASLAERVAASINTIRRLEKGDPRIPLHFLARTLLVFGELERLRDVLSTRDDLLGLALMDEQLPERIRARKAPSSGPGM